MPRRGGRAQLLRDIVARDMEELSEVVDEDVHPEDVRPGGRWEEFYSNRRKKLSQLSTEELAQLASAAGIEPNNVGRPRLMADNVMLIERVKKWLHKFGRCGRWIGCLTAGTVVLANQERR
jgi:hypothetical protein